MYKLTKNIFLCGKSPDGDDVYTDGQEFYKIDGLVYIKPAFKAWHFIVGLCEA